MLNLGPETEYVEHKKSTGEIKEGMQSIGSILNKHGRGTLYFGTLDNGDVIGQQVGKSTLRDVSQAVGNDIKPTIHPTIERLTTEDGKDYIRVEFHGNERPYACRGIYRTRVADEDVVMSDDELRQIVLYEQARKVPWDQWESDRPISDVDEDELRAFVERGNACGRIPEPFTTVEETLQSLSLLHDGKLTNAADVLFCPSRTSGLAMGILATHARTEILDLHQEAGTLFELVRKAEHYILVNTRRRFVIEGGGPREEIPELPQDAVREVLFNAFAHRDRISRGVVQIDIYNDAVEITNPGWFIDGQDPAAHISGADKSSLSRNMLIVNTLHKSKDIEAYGTGIPRIRDACKEAGVEFEYKRVPIGTCFIFHRKDAFADNPELQVRDSAGKVREKCGKVRERYGKELLSSELNVAEFIESEGKASTREIMARTGLSERGTQQLLKRLIEKGIVEKDGTGRKTRYTLSEKLLS